MPPKQSRTSSSGLTYTKVSGAEDMEAGPRGIVIVFSAFMVQFLAFGNYACIGIYTVHLLHIFENDAVSVSLISAIHSALLLCTGPLASFLMTKISFRKLSIAGAALVSMGIFLTPWLVYLPAMYIFFGVFAGLGGCLIYLPSHVLSGLYYEKHRTLSTGVASAGTGLGATVMPLVVGMLIEEYTWRGSLVILAGLDLHLFIFALFMVPPRKKDKRQKTSKHRVHKSHKDTVPESHVRESTDVKPGKADEASHYDKLEQKCENNDRGQNSQHCYEQRNVNSACERNGEADPANYVKLRQVKGRSVENLCADLGNISLDSIPDDDISRVFIPSYLTWVSSYRNSLYIGRCNSIMETAILDTVHHSVHESSVAECDNEETEIEVISLVSSTNNSTKNNSLKEHFKNHIRVLTDLKFIIYFISIVIWSMTTTMFVTFGPDLIVMKGHAPVDAAFVFTFYGVGQLMGCIFISIIGNFLGHRIVFYMVANLLIGVFMGLVPLVFFFYRTGYIVSILGFCLGGVTGLYMIVTVDILGEKDMEIGLGYVLMASGMGCFTGPPVGGLLSTIFGRYEECFYMAGAITLFAGFIMTFLFFPQCRNKKETTKRSSFKKPNNS